MRHKKIVVEVRRQFKEIKGLIDGKAEADYETCVDICTKSFAKRDDFPPPHSEYLHR